MRIIEDVIEHQDAIDAIADKAVDKFGSVLLDYPRRGGDSSPAWAMTVDLPAICRVVAVRLAITRATDLLAKRI